MLPQAFSVVVVSICALTSAGTGNVSMQAAGLDSAKYMSSAVKVSLLRMPVPTPAYGQVLVKVMSSSVNHLDLLWTVIDPSFMWPTFVAAWQVEGGFPKVLGLDVAGTVTAVGPGVSRFKAGDEVWAYNAAACEHDPHFVGGIAGHAWAEYVAIDEDMVGLKPVAMSFSQAGTLPLDALTALGALKSAGAPWKTGGHVLVLGATGGVGHFAVQLAKALGATKVIATASESNRALVELLGVDQFMDYHTSNWWDSSVVPDRSLDAVVDTVLQPQTGDRAYSKLRNYGSFVSLCQGIPNCGAPMASTFTRFMSPTLSQTALQCTDGSCAGTKQLDELRSYVDEGKLKVHVQNTVPLSSIADAIAWLESGHTVGKIGIEVSKGDEVIFF